MERGRTSPLHGRGSSGGAVTYARSRRWLALVLSLLALLAAPLPFFGNPRFHVPLLPLLAVAAAIALSSIAGRWRSPSSPPPR